VGQRPHLGIQTAVRQHLLELAGLAAGRPQGLDAPGEPLDLGYN
jgi:hypothetical protein